MTIYLDGQPLICAWCTDFDPADPANAGRSHGICPRCSARLLAALGRTDTDSPTPPPSRYVVLVPADYLGTACVVVRYLVFLGFLIGGLQWLGVW